MSPWTASKSHYLTGSLRMWSVFRGRRRGHLRSGIRTSWRAVCACDVSREAGAGGGRGRAGLKRTLMLVVSANVLLLHTQRSRVLHDSELPSGYTFMSRRAPSQFDGLYQQFLTQPCGSSARAWASMIDGDFTATVNPEAATLAALHSVASVIAVSPAAAHDAPDVRTTKSDDAAVASRRCVARFL